MPSSLPIIAITALLTLAAAPAPDTQVDTFTGTGSAPSDAFGASVAVDALYAVVGAPGADSNTGAAYVFRRERDGTWLQVDTLLADDAAADDFFGSCVAIQRDIIMVGAPGDDLNEGAAYVFKRQRDGTFLQVDKLTAEDNAADDAFGASIAFDKNTAVVGATGDESGAGSIYVFRRLPNAQWDQLTKLVASDTAADAAFGASVAIRKNTILVGAPGASDTGAAYIFENEPLTSWTETEIITAEDADDDDLFGASVALENFTALIGAPGDDLAAGAAYIFTLTRGEEGFTWEQTDKLIAEDDAADDAVGTSVALEGTTAVVGALGDDADTGAVFIFRRQRDATWPQIERLTAEQGDINELFGTAVAIDRGYAVIGAPGTSTETGAGYVFR